VPAKYLKEQEEAEKAATAYASSSSEDEYDEYGDLIVKVSKKKVVKRKKRIEGKALKDLACGIKGLDFLAK